MLGLAVHEDSYGLAHGTCPGWAVRVAGAAAHVCAHRSDAAVVHSHLRWATAHVRPVACHSPS